MAWTAAGSLKGPQGDPGDTGETGATGSAGAPGLDGAGVSIAGQVANYAALPNNLGNTNADRGKGYLNDADGLLYTWSGTAFPSNGNGVEFRGPQGIQGTQGNAGTAGADGARGSKWFTGAGAPSGVGGSLPGDFYLDTNSGAVYELS